MEKRTNIIAEVTAERNRQTELAVTDDGDRTNTRNDWVAYVSAYTGRAAAKCHRNEQEGQQFRANMIKVAALAVAAIEAHDNGFC